MKSLFFLIALCSSVSFAAEPLPPLKVADYNDPIRVACVGDSITQGYELPSGKSYPDQLQEMLGAEWKVSNFGVSGRTLMKRGDVPYWKENAYQDALKLQADVVIIMLGTNDAKPKNWSNGEEFTADYTEFVKSFQTSPAKPRIYVCRPCPVLGAGNFEIDGQIVKSQVKLIDGIVKQMGLGMIDMYGALNDKPELLPDRVHPNAEGARELAKAAYKALTGKKAPSLAEKP